MEKDFTLVYSTTDPIQAEIAKDILEESKINSVILNQHDSMIPSLGQLEVYVHINDKDNALEILKNLKS